MTEKLERMQMVLRPAIIRENPTGPVIWYWMKEDTEIPHELYLIGDEKNADQ